MSGKPFVLRRRAESVTVVELMIFIKQAPPPPGETNDDLLDVIEQWLFTFVEDPDPSTVEYATDVEISK